MQQHKPISQSEEPVLPVMGLEEAFGSVTPLSQPEDFEALRQAAMEDHAEKVVEEMKGGANEAQAGTRRGPA
jgi:hypothetical protein